MPKLEGIIPQSHRVLGLHAQACRLPCPHHVLHGDSQLFAPTALHWGVVSKHPLPSPLPLFRIKWMAAAHSILTFPLLFASSLFNEAGVQVRAASCASFKIGCTMVRATVAGAGRALQACVCSLGVPHGFQEPTWGGSGAIA